MRIARLELLAYGHFRGLALDLGAPGLHVVFGRNEAGKSTTLRAITGLLYGIDARTRDAHVHKPADLRIGGLLVGADGEQVRVVRRKGNANTLLDDRGQPLDENVMLRLLHGVSEETFRRAFGLDHETLARGAEGLLQGKGDLGEGLFDASVGGGGEVQRTLKDLTDQAERIYKPRGSSLPLNDALRAFTDAQKRVRERQSLPEAYVAQTRALEEAETRRAEEAKRRSKLVSSRAELERARRRAPLLRRKSELSHAREGFGDLGKHAARAASWPARIVTYERTTTLLRELRSEGDRMRDRVADAGRRAAIAPDVVQSLRLDARKEARIQKLVVEKTTLAERIEASRTELTRAERSLARLSANGPLDNGNPKDAAALGRAVSRARALGDAEARHDADRSRAERRRKELSLRGAALGLYEGTLDALVALRIPQESTLDRLAKAEREIEGAFVRIDGRITALDTERATLERQLAEQSGDFAPPNLSDLKTVRAHRKDAWAAVVRADKNDRADAERAFETAMSEADDVADRMIREADRVTLVARLRSAKQALQAERDALAEERSRFAVERAALAAEHADLWRACGVAAIGIAEMRTWRSRHTQIAEAHVELRGAELSLEEGAARMAGVARELSEALAANGIAVRAGAALAELLDTATELLERIETRQRTSEENARATETLKTELEERRLAVERDTARAGEISTSLAELVQPLGIPDDASPEEIARGLEALRDLFALVDKKAELEARQDAHEREAKAFEDELADLLAELGPDLARLPKLDAATAFIARVEEAQRVERELSVVAGELDGLERDGDVSNDALRLADDPAAYATALETLDGEIDTVGHDLSRLDKEIGGIELGLKSLRGDSHAADAAAEVQEAVARIRVEVERYSQAKLAAVLLSREIERYREENQGPLLSCASKLFSRLTLAAFSGIRAGFDEHDKPALRCVRTGGAEVDVAGLSEGTRDQLYLSLRLASLIRHAEVARPMPLVLDDVFVHFDDERSRAALGVLAEVASSMQVLFFTHHARLVELARAAVPSGELHVHELSSVAPVQTELSLPAEP